MSANVYDILRFEKISRKDVLCMKMKKMDNKNLIKGALSIQSDFVNMS